MVREIEVEVAPHGVKGTLAIPPAVDDEDGLSKGYAPATLKCALILHGQAGHRNYCYQKSVAHKLATELGIYSLRIDFRGCGLSPELPDPQHEGRTVERDIEDIQHAAEFLTDAAKNPLGLSFTLSSIIAHSRGSLTTFLWAMEQNRLLASASAQDRAAAIIVPNIVNCSSRFRSDTVLDRYPIADDFEGVHQKCSRYGELTDVWVPRAEIMSLASPDLSVLAELTTESSVLSIYGLDDHIVPVDDSARFANVLNRGKYSHELVLIPGADHNFYGVEEVRSASDHEEFNPEQLPLTSRHLVNYNVKVVQLILDFLSPEREFERFWYNSRHIGHLTRWKEVDGVANFRDIGGWHVNAPPAGLHIESLPSSELYVRPKVAFRCANMAGVSARGLRELQSLGVRTIFDLRSDGECAKDGVPQGLAQYGIRRVHAPCFTKQDYSPQAIAIRYSNLMTSWHTYVNVYDKLLNEATDTFRKIFKYIRDDVPTGAAFVFHCTAGKDRTGVLAMLILLLVGVDKHTVAKEYELTTFGLRPDHEEIRGKFVATIDKVKEKLAAAGSTMVYEDTIRAGRDNWKIEVDGFNNLISSRYEAMLSTIDLLDSKYGGVVNYMKEWLKFSSADLATIYKNLVQVDTSGGYESTSFVKYSHRAARAPQNGSSKAKI